MLQQYAKKEYIPELLYFWYHIVEYRQMLEQNSEEITEKELLMRSLYIEAKSEYSLNISHDLRQTLCSNPHQREAWLEVQDEIAKLIRSGPYLRLALNISSKVEESWKMVLKRVSMEKAGTLFYRSLSQLAPSTRQLFKGGASLHAKMFSEMIDGCMDLLVNLEELINLAFQLGIRHAMYGVRPVHLRFGREALLSMLQHVLGKQFDKKTRNAWIAVYELLSTLMIMAIDPSQADSLIVQPPDVTSHSGIMSTRRISAGVDRTSEVDNEYQHEPSTPGRLRLKRVSRRRQTICVVAGIFIALTGGCCLYFFLF
jgi:nitric oxide dioxygenase